jgi:hypothetical protein
MDVATDLVLPDASLESNNALSYDDTVAYEEQIPTAQEADPRSKLASRIGNTKVYLLADTSAAARNAKVSLCFCRFFPFFLSKSTDFSIFAHPSLFVHPCSTQTHTLPYHPGTTISWRNMMLVTAEWR